MRNLIAILAVVAFSALASTTSSAGDPYTMANNTWISLSGEVTEVHPNSFRLDYGGGSILVEMDDGDRDSDGYKLLKGDAVTVNGRIDDDFFETTTIEASSVYVEKLNTYFYASAIDEEDPFVAIPTPVVHSTTVAQGTVTAVDGDEFSLDTGIRELTVEVEEMPYNPLDDEGYQKIEVGDMVSVTGELDYDLFEGREIEAKSITTLVKHFEGDRPSR